MNTKSVKKTKLWIILISLFVVIEVLLIGATLAWFTDQKSSSATLKFGTIELDDTGSNATGLAVSIARGGTTLTSEEAIMPGDKVDININVKLKTTSQPAYYLVYLEHDELFGDKEFFFKSGTKTAATDETSEIVYATDGTKIYQVNENGTIGDGTESTEVAGKISGGETHTLAFSLTIDETATTLPADKEISCTVYAIQQANLTAKQAYKEIVKQTIKPTFVKGAITLTSYKKISFCSEIPSTVTQTPNETLTATYNSKVTNEDEKGLIQVYTNSDSTEIAFVSDRKILAPENCSQMFAGYYSSLTSLDLSGWDTSNVTTMHSMFAYCSSLTSLNLTGWDTSNVTTMSNMFATCSNLTSLNLSGFDTSKVTSMFQMFQSCSKLTTLTFGDNFDTSKVTNMMSMFESCSSLTSLDVSGWNTSSVTNMAIMFLKCSSLTSLNVSNFDTSNVTDMSYMFSVCSALISLDLSGWDTSKVTCWDYMFSNTFSNNPSGSELKISNKFVIDGNVATASSLNNKTSLNTSVTVTNVDLSA